METTYSYNARNQLIRSQSLDTQNRDTRWEEINTEYNYDPRGNLTRVLENGIIKRSYGYDATNRMTEATTAEGVRAEYVYNGFLKRVKRLEEMGSIQGSIQPNTPTGVPEPTKEIRYLLDLTRPYNDLLATEGQTSFSYLSDHLGSPVRLMGGREEEVLAYDEFGVPTVEAGAGTSLHNPFGFTGYQMDDVSGLYYAQARYYEPEVGRFFAVDTHWNTNNMIYGDHPYNRVVPNIFAIRQSANLYSYCLNNPHSFIDPTGMAASPAPTPSVDPTPVPSADGMDAVSWAPSPVPTLSPILAPTPGIAEPVVPAPGPAPDYVNAPVESTVKVEGDSYLVTTKLSKFVEVSWKIQGGNIFFLFTENNYWEVVKQGQVDTLAAELYDVTKSIDSNLLRGRTIGEMGADLQLHYAAYLGDKAVSNLVEFITGQPYSILEDFDPQHAKMGGMAKEDHLRYDRNAWVFELANLLIRHPLLNESYRRILEGGCLGE